MLVRVVACRTITRAATRRRARRIARYLGSSPRPGACRTSRCTTTSSWPTTAGYPSPLRGSYESENSETPAVPRLRGHPEEHGSAPSPLHGGQESEDEARASAQRDLHPDGRAARMEAGLMSSHQRRLDAEADREYLMGFGKYWDDTNGFVAHRPHSMCWVYLVVGRISLVGPWWPLGRAAILPWCVAVGESLMSVNARGPHPGRSRASAVSAPHRPPHAPGRKTPPGPSDTHHATECMVVPFGQVARSGSGSLSHRPRLAVGCSVTRE